MKNDVLVKTKKMQNKLKTHYGHSDLELVPVFITVTTCSNSRRGSDFTTTTVMSDTAAGLAMAEVTLVTCALVIFFTVTNTESAVELANMKRRNTAYP